VGDDFGLGDFQTLDGDGMLVGSWSSECSPAHFCWFRFIGLV
jgi:hypothetical protein